MVVKHSSCCQVGVVTSLSSSAQLDQKAGIVFV